MTNQASLYLTELVTFTLRSFLRNVWRVLTTPISFKWVSGYLVEEVEKPIEDTRRYIVTASKRFGLRGYGKYTAHPVMVLSGLYDVEIEGLMKQRYKVEPHCFMGSRSELMGQVKCLTNEDFDSAISIDDFRIEVMKSYAKAQIANMHGSYQHVFRHWLVTQVELGNIVAIDGYIFKDNTPNPHNRNSFLIKKNCEPRDFLYKYYDSMVIGAKYKLCDNYYSVEELAAELMYKITLHAFGIGADTPITDLFVPINTIIRDRDTISSVDRNSFSTVGETLLK